MNDLTPIKSSGALVAAAPNNFEAYSEAASGNRIIGDLLKFSKGDWLFGRNSDEMARGTRLVANIADLKVGMVKWEGGKPVDAEMGRVADGYRMPKREDLGSTDKDLWERDEVSGQPRDPWQLTNVLILKAEKGDQLFTFSPSSKGGVGAIAKLAGEYGKRVRSHPNDLPIVALEVDSYSHPNKALGRIKVPVLKIVGWTASAGFEDALAAEAAEAEEMSDLPFDEAPAAAVTATGRGGKPSRSAEF
jgi:hypothetical protein